MKVKLTCGLIVIIFILNVITVSWNHEFRADAPENYPQDSSRSASKPLTNGDFDWKLTDVLSEPVNGNNFNAGGSRDPAIAVEDDKIYVVWSDYNNTNNAGTDQDIFYRHFDGIVWGDIQVISEPVFGQNFCTGQSGWPRIAIENGSVYVVWTDINDTNGAGSGRDIFYRTNLSGNGWEPIQVISEPVQGQDFNIGMSWIPEIDVEDGKAYVVWVEWNNTNNAGDSDADLCYRCNLTGSSWEPIQVISEPVPYQNINTGLTYEGAIAVENGKIYVSWGDETNLDGSGNDADIFYRANLTGTSWEDIQVISEPISGQNINTVLSYGDDIAVENGIIYVVWNDSNNTNGAGTDDDIFYRVNLTGTSWESVQVISEPEPGKNINTGFSRYPEIVVKKGGIHVVWQDDNNTNGAGTDNDRFYRCNFTRLRWEPVQVISEPIFGKSFNNGGTFSQSNSIAINDKLHVVWHDDNNTDGSGADEDIFYRCRNVVLPTLFLNFPKVKPKFGNTSSKFNFTVTYNHLNNTPPSVMKVLINSVEH
jgi:hypothetical protein